MKKSLLLLISVALMHFTFAQSTDNFYVSVDDAETIGINFHHHQAVKLNHEKNNRIEYSIKDRTSMQSANGSECMHVFNFDNGGYVIVSADRRSIPILAYSFEEEFNFEDLAPATQDWINNKYISQIELLSNSDQQPSENISMQWEMISNNVFSEEKSSRGVEPLLETRWNQDYPYNMYAPEHTEGPGGHVYAGCVATAMAQVMKFWDYPASGHGSLEFFYGDYYSVDFESTTYAWDEMSNQINNSSKESIAELIYHCGASVNMSWGYDGSGTQTEYTVSALKQYFKYRTGVYFLNKAEVTDSEWKFKLKEDIDNSHPIIYSGTDLEVGMGHAFVCDGYQDTSYFHFNWGWGGANNGFYFIDALTPGTNNFSYGEGVVLNITPIDSDYCSTNTIYTLPEYTFGDGSGANYYFNNTYCDWIINPQIDSIEMLKLSFTKFDLAENDVLKVYQGSNSNPSLVLVGEYTKDNEPSTIRNWNGNKFYLVFETDGEGQADGWEAYYTTFTSGVETNTLTGISLYPNPANETININGISNSNVAIYDIYGKLIKEYSDMNSSTIDISDMSDGVYFMNISNKDGIKTLKFIKN